MHTPRVFLNTASLPREIAEIDWPMCSAGAAGTGSLSGVSRPRRGRAEEESRGGFQRCAGIDAEASRKCLGNDSELSARVQGLHIRKCLGSVSGEVSPESAPF